MSATAADHRDHQTRSYPNGRNGDHATSGFEFIEDLKMADHAERIAAEAGELLEAEACPTLGTTDLILDGSCLALQIHESVGHPMELDRALGWEKSMAGGTRLTPDLLGKVQYGSPVVNISADATIPRGLATFGYDDEGVPAQRAELVKAGTFCGYLNSRETAGLLGQQSMGSVRSPSWNKLQLVRMTNVNLDPGDWRKDEIIKDTRDGIYMEGMGAVSIDDMRINFQSSPELAYEVKDGSLGKMYRNPSYSGKSMAFWRSCDAVSHDDWRVWGLPSCGKGQPGQIVHVGHGASATRYRDIKVGV